MDGKHGVVSCGPPRTWRTIGRAATIAAIAGPIIGMLVWLVPSPFAPCQISLHVVDTTNAYSPEHLEVRGPGDAVAFLDADWRCVVDKGWVGRRVRLVDGRTGVEVASAHLTPDRGGTARLWIR